MDSVSIVAHGSDKGSALRLVAERLGIDMARVMAIGDALADLPMIEAAGVGVAMGQSIPRVRDGADLIAPRNDAGGVAWAVERCR